MRALDDLKGLLKTSPLGLSSKEIGHHLGMSGTELADYLEVAKRDGIALSFAGQWVLPSATEALMKLAIEALEDEHKATPENPMVEIASLQTTFKTWPAKAIVRLCTFMEDRGHVRTRSNLVALANHRANLPTKQRELINRVVEFLSKNPIEFLDRKQVSADIGLPPHALDAGIELAIQMDEVREVAPGLYLANESEQKLIETARNHLARGKPFSPSEFGNAVGLSRRLGIPILEFLDRRGVTKRVEEGRVFAQ